MRGNTIEKETAGSLLVPTRFLCRDKEGWGGSERAGSSSVIGSVKIRLKFRMSFDEFFEK